MNATLEQEHPTTAAANGHRAEEKHADPPQRARTRTIVIIAVVIVALFAVFLALGIVHRFRQSHDWATGATQAASAPPQVYIIHPIVSATPEWSLPASTQAMQDAIIYARVSGYLSKRYVDIGDHVKAGQLLAEIQSPELDQQLSQAKANLQQSYKQLDLQKANLELARITMERYKGADQDAAVAKLTVDQAV